MPRRKDCDNLEPKEWLALPSSLVGTERAARGRNSVTYDETPTKHRRNTDETPTKHRRNTDETPTNPPKVMP
jgi:hypothetical protein